MTKVEKVLNSIPSGIYEVDTGRLCFVKGIELNPTFPEDLSLGRVSYYHLYETTFQDCLKISRLDLRTFIKMSGFKKVFDWDIEKRPDLPIPGSKWMHKDNFHEVLTISEVKYNWNKTEIKVHFLDSGEFEKQVAIENFGQYVPAL